LTDVVLVGGGHAHVQVLKSFAMRPVPGARLTVVVDTPIAVYSGMVPGFVAGQYAREDLEIDVLPLARLAGARVILAAATGVDAGENHVKIEGRAPIAFDYLSLDIGSSVAGLDTPGVRDYALATRPIGRFVGLVDERLARASPDPASPVHAVVVGAGAGGVELAFTLRERLVAGGGSARVTLIDAADTLLPGSSPKLVQAVAREAEARGIRVVTGSRVEAVESDRVLTGDGQIPADLVVWVAGAASHPMLRESGLPTDSSGFLLTRSTLQLEGLDHVFAAGDCATLVDHPWVPRAGVYAVRQGPVLADNLRRAVAGGTGLRVYGPQRDFLTLLNLGDGTAIGAKWGRSITGRRAFRLKDRIDRRFVRRFQTLGTESDVTPEFTQLASMRSDMDVLCGGCAAKLGQGDLERALGRLGRIPAPESVELGIEQGDDAAAYSTPGGTRVISSVDQFRAFTDDPFLVGRVGAVNATSDVLAKGVAPRIAQAIIALPDGVGSEEQGELLFQVLSGARTVFDEMGVALVGGHTTTAADLLVGFLVEGFAAPSERLLTLDRLEAGCDLILTKALGTGVVFHADMKGRVRGPWFQAAVDSALRSNAGAVRIAAEFGATAATDVTGFGLARHLAGMLRASGVSAVIELSRLPWLPGVRSLLAAGLRSTVHEQNARAAPGISFDSESSSHPRLPLLYDPQTSGGLLFGVSPDRTEGALRALHDEGYGAATAIGSTKLFSDVRLQVNTGV
jgi:selenide,water dikinase